jgi:hypothetical protein
MAQVSTRAAEQHPAGGEKRAPTVARGARAPAPEHKRRPAVGQESEASGYPPMKTTPARPRKWASALTRSALA